MKSATTSLYFHLKQHTEVCMSEPKEPNYFCNEELKLYSEGVHSQKNVVIDSVEDYHGVFTNFQNKKIIGEASVSYLYFYNSAERIKSYNDSAMIIIILRNPMERAYSAYSHLVREGDERLLFEKALSLESERIEQKYPPIYHLKKAGLYYEQVSHYLRIFGEEKIYLIDYDDYHKDTLNQFKKICSFLNISTDFIPLNIDFRYNQSGNLKKHLSFFRRVFQSKILRKTIARIFALSYTQKQIILSKFYGLIFKKAQWNDKNELMREYFEEDWCKTIDLIAKQKNSYFK